MTDKTNNDNDDNEIIFFDFTQIVNNLNKKKIIKKTSTPPPTNININFSPDKPIKYIFNYDIKHLHTIEGLLLLCNKYKNINNKEIQTLILIENELNDINNLIGMTELKKMLCKQILYFIQIDKPKSMLFNTVLYGEPGSGKTTIAKIIGNIFLKLGYLQNNNFIIAKRSDLIAGYLGQTAIKTQKIIDSAEGGVLFIDEVYSLGNDGNNDSFSKECIDTINQNLSEKNFICIIAGYEDDVKKFFFSKNKGLERRFPWIFTIDKTKPYDLYLIFIKFIEKDNFKFKKNDTNKLILFFKNNSDYFKYNGGSLENFFNKVKINFFQNFFGRKKKIIHVLDIDIINETFNIYKLYENNGIIKETPPPFGMYI